MTTRLFCDDSGGVCENQISDAEEHKRAYGHNEQRPDHNADYENCIRHQTNP